MKTCLLALAAFSFLILQELALADSSGTGFFVSPAGYLVTNYHVVKDGTRLIVKFGETEAPAKIIAVDKVNDIALLKLASSDKPTGYLEVNTGSIPTPGSEVFTIGFPDPGVLGLSPKTTRGTLTSTAGLQDDPRFMQISVQIQPGNSGGPLVDLTGRVIGVTTSTLNATERLKDSGYLPQNVNYALKASYLRGVFDQVQDATLSAPTTAAKEHPFAEVQQATQNAVALVLAVGETPPASPPIPAPAPPAPHPQKLAKALIPEMVKLPGGEFWMGSDDSDKEALDNEKPKHKVRVEPFNIGKYEVTRGQYAAFVKATGRTSGPSCMIIKNGKKTQPGGDWRDPGFKQQDNHPVVCVSLADTHAYIQWLNGKTGKAYRLPTEAEWEYAARAGTNTTRYWGDNPKETCRYANGADLTAEQEFGAVEIHNCKDGYAYTAPVGSFEANGFKLYDMLGNVLEWTCSVIEEKYAGGELKCLSVMDTHSPRIMRGGGWGTIPISVRSAGRAGSNRDHRSSVLGFRLALD